MDKKEIEINERKYLALVSPDEQQGAFVVIGPPEGLVDELGIPEPQATRLHNILYDRKIFKFQDVARPNVAIGVIQELYAVDAQKLVEMFMNFEKEPVGG